MTQLNIHITVPEDDGDAIARAMIQAAVDRGGVGWAVMAVTDDGTHYAFTEASEGTRPWLYAHDRIVTDDHDLVLTIPERLAESLLREITRALSQGAVIGPWAHETMDVLTQMHVWYQAQREKEPF